MDNKNRVAPPVFTLHGLELEFHVSEGGVSVDTAGLGKKLNGDIERYGQLDSDAGIGLAEAITHPFSSMQEAAEALKHIVAALPGEWRKDFVVYRPEDLGPASWANKPRYEALKQAAAAERPESWQLINQMTGLASVHVNMSGAGFDPLDPEGQLLMNVLRNAGPYIASRIHQFLNDGRGHLSLWDFADKRRMPDFNRWHPDFRSFNDEFAGKPRFVGETELGSGIWQPQPSGSCSVYDDIDLGTYWDFARPKRNPTTSYGHYLEVRLLPSMHPDRIFTFAEAMRSICELTVLWHRTEKGSAPLSREEAVPVFAYVASFHKAIFPEKPLDEATWNRLLKE